MPYHRALAVEYARRHAMRVRRGEYLNGSDADATAFVCRCLNAAGGALYFDDAEGLYRALLSGEGELFARECGPEDLRPGDVVQIRAYGARPFRSMFVTGRSPEGILVAARSYSACDRPLESYLRSDLRCLHIE